MAFNENIEEYTVKTPAHAEEFNSRQSKLLENDKFLNEKYKDINLEMTKKATKDGTVQTNLNSEKLNGKTANNAALTNEKVDIIGMINEVFTSASDGKSLVTNAITGKGVNANDTDTFSVLASKIGQINTGKKWASGTKPYGSLTYTVNNLNFKPSVIVIGDGGNNVATYWESFNINYSNMLSNVIYGGFTYSGQYTELHWIAIE